MNSDHSPRPRLGFLYPGYAAEDDYPAMAQQLPSQPIVELVHTSVGVDAHRIDALLDLGSPERLAEAAEHLRDRVDAVMWACTSASFVFGWDGARTQSAAISEALGVPVSSTSFAFVEAARALDVHAVAIAATYPEDVAHAFADFLGHAKIKVASVAVQDITTAAEVGRLQRDQVVEFVAAGDHPDAEAVLVPDTALHTVASLADLEQALGKPVLTANQVTMWEALRLVDAPRECETLGALFRRR
ncbi:MAG TPA: hypothetical protein VGA13_12055 [Acidimicrobiales bacterium]